MISKTYIHEYGNGKLEPEHLDVKNVLESRGIVCELFTSKRMHRNQLKLDKNTMVVGDHPTIQSILKRIGYTQEFCSYPISLRSYLKRNVWETTIGSLLAESSMKDISKLFIKPKSKSKLFTGFVIHSNNDLFQLYNHSKNTILLVSSVVEWISEYRVFVLHSEIVGIKIYSGNDNLNLNMTIVKNAINDFEKSPERTAGYSLDFGILSNGDTALIEWNDGYALGAYKLNKEIYTELILARWEEILKNIATNNS